MTEAKRKRGRPEMPEPQVKKLIALTENEWALLEKLGDGQITRGVREAIKIINK